MSEGQLALTASPGAMLWQGGRAPEVGLAARRLLWLRWEWAPLLRFSQAALWEMPGGRQARGFL